MAYKACKKDILDVKTKEQIPKNGERRAEDRMQGRKSKALHVLFSIPYALFMLIAILLVASTLSVWGATIEGRVEIAGFMGISVDDVPLQKDSRRNSK